MQNGAMRTTIGLDDDVTNDVQLRGAEYDAGLPETDSHLIRQGLAAAATVDPFVQETTRMGQPLVPMDNTAETLDILAGEARR